MAKIKRTFSPYAQQAALLLGQLVRTARIKRRMTANDLSLRAGISRGLLRRIEAGDPTSTIGAVFEVAAIVGVKLFDAEQGGITSAIESNREVMTLLPRAVRRGQREIKDDF
jgi:transcriptional regulator with XRE-family HTH domain